MVWGSLLSYCSKQEKWDYCFNCEFIKGECTRSENHDGVLDAGSLVPSSIHFRISLQVRSSVTLLHENILDLVKYIVEKENCGLSWLL